MERFGQSFVEYRKGVIDLAPFSLASVTIDMDANRLSNFAQARTALKEKWNAEGKDGRDDWTEADIKKWANDNNLTIHECCDMRTCQFVPREIHQTFHHTGGFCECKIRDGKEAVFDD